MLQKIETKKAQIKRLEKKYSKLWNTAPSWIGSIVKPIAEILLKLMPDRYYEILGPFGPSCTVSIHFYKKDVSDNEKFEGDNCKSISFRPGNLMEGEINIINYESNTNQYSEGSIGEINGMNYPSILLSGDIYIEDLITEVK